MDRLLLFRVALLVVSRGAAVFNFVVGLLGISLAGGSNSLDLGYGSIVPMFVLGVLPLRPKWSTRARTSLVLLAIVGIVFACAENVIYGL